MVFIVYTQGSYNVVAVSQAVIGKATVKETIQPLVGSHPQAVPLVEKHIFDEIEARCQFLYLISIILIECVRVGQNQAAVILASCDYAVVGRLEVESGFLVCAFVAYCV